MRFSADAGRHLETSIEKLLSLRPSFKNDGGRQHVLGGGSAYSSTWAAGVAAKAGAVSHTDVRSTVLLCSWKNYTALWLIAWCEDAFEDISDGDTSQVLVDLFLELIIIVYRRGTGQDQVSLGVHSG